MSDKPAPTHSAGKIVLITATAIILILTLTFNFLSAGVATSRITRDSNVTQSGPQLYLSDTGSISDKYDTAITPSGPTFTIWSFIYIWQIAHIVYAFTLICRKNADGEYLYNAEHSHIHYSFFIVYILNNCVNTSWIFLFDRELLVWSFIFLSLITVTLYIGGVIVCISLNKAGAMLERSRLMYDIWLTRLLTLNGVAFYGTWVTIATLLNMSIMMRYSANVPMEVCTWLSLAILTCELGTWFVLETFIFDRYLRYVFSPYITLIVALSGILQKQWASPFPAYLYYLSVLLGISALLGIVKVIVMIAKGIRCPINYTPIMNDAEKDVEQTNM